MHGSHRSTRSALFALTFATLGLSARTSDAGIVWTVVGSQPQARALAACYNATTYRVELYQIDAKGVLSVNLAAGADGSWMTVGVLPGAGATSVDIACIENGLLVLEPVAAPGGGHVISRYDFASRSFSSYGGAGNAFITATPGYASFGIPDNVFSLDPAAGTIYSRYGSGAWNAIVSAPSGLVDLAVDNFTGTGAPGGTWKGKLVALVSTRTAPTDDGVRTIFLRSPGPVAAWETALRDPSGATPSGSLRYLAATIGKYFAIDAAGSVLLGYDAPVVSRIF